MLVEDMIKRTFSENSAQKALPEQQNKFEETTKTLESLDKLSCIICDADIHGYYQASSEIVLLNHELREFIMASSLASKVILQGRVVIINNSFYRNSRIDF